MTKEEQDKLVAETSGVKKYAEEVEAEATKLQEEWMKAHLQRMIQ